MAKKKKNFWSRLSGGALLDEEEFGYQDEASLSEESVEEGAPEETWDDGDAQLSVDMFETPNDIVIKAFVAGVQPEDLDVSISQEMVTIRGDRRESRTVEEDGYFFKELFWGSFARTITLPQEVDTEEAEAESDHGMLVIHLPKVDKQKKTKLKVKSGK